eukprot:8790551-Alexandrium_andersonii.AAC.1
MPCPGRCKVGWRPRSSGSEPGSPRPEEHQQPGSATALMRDEPLSTCHPSGSAGTARHTQCCGPCLLYTSDAADDM